MGKHRAWKHPSCVAQPSPAPCDPRARTDRGPGQTPPHGFQIYKCQEEGDLEGSDGAVYGFLWPLLPASHCSAALSSCVSRPQIHRKETGWDSVPMGRLCPMLLDSHSSLREGQAPAALCPPLQHPNFAGALPTESWERTLNLQFQLHL